MSYTPVDYNPYDFANRRHIGPSPSEMEEMLKVVGVKTLDELIDQTVPASIRQSIPLGWAPLSEHELLARMRAVGARNKVMTSLIGQGYYGTVTPPAIQRNILENPAWYTAYTPYQPEIAQGRLEALLNYQTMIADLTGLPVANASFWTKRRRRQRPAGGWRNAWRSRRPRGSSSITAAIRRRSR